MYYTPIYYELTVIYFNQVKTTKLSSCGDFSKASDLYYHPSLEVKYQLLWKILELEPSLRNLRSLLEMEKLYPCQCTYGRNEKEQCIPSSSMERGMWSHGYMQPNKMCHKKMVHTENNLPYSRGGAGGSSGLSEEERLILQDEQAQMMYTTAISFAASLDCHLKPGVSTRGLGDCLIEACID